MPGVRKEIKCVVWDLDETIWNGILLEKDNVQLKTDIIKTLQTLDSRGILNSIASRNDYGTAMAKLDEFDIRKFFLYPQIGWDAKSVSIGRIQKNLNFGIDTFLFIDDQQFERDEVQSVYPDVLCLNASEYDHMLAADYLNPRFITQDSARRRMMYQADIKRNQIEEKFEGPNEVFLSSLEMKFTISLALEEDLKRAEELTVRTNQLNATAITYDYDELNKFRTSKNHKLLICELKDKYGTYGKIGLALIEMHAEYWHLKLLLMSCRVMARGVGTVLLSYIMNEAKREGKQLRADFRKTDRNRMMYISYKMANFKEIECNEDNGYILFENDLSMIQNFPDYIQLVIDE